MITGEEIRRLRKEKKWTQQDLANEVGVAKTTVLDWEKNRYSPEGKNVNNLARALNVSIAYLMGETDEPRPRTREESFEIQAPVEMDMIVAKRSPIQAAPDEIELVVRRGGHQIGRAHV